MWYCSLPFFKQLALKQLSKKIEDPFFSFLFFLEPSQPVMAPNLVPLHETFNHQTSFSLFFSVLCKNSHAPSCPQAWLQQPGQKAASPYSVFCCHPFGMALPWELTLCLGPLRLTEKLKQRVASGGSILIAGPRCTTITKFFSERGCDCYAVYRNQCCPCTLVWAENACCAYWREDAGISTCGLQISNVLACRKHWAAQLS